LKSSSSKGADGRRKGREMDTKREKGNKKLKKKVEDGGS